MDAEGFSDFRIHDVCRQHSPRGLLPRARLRELSFRTHWPGDCAAAEALCLIELVLGLFALVSPYAFDLVDNLYGELYRAFADRIALLILCAFHSGLARRSAPNNTHGRNAPALLPLVCRQRLKDR